MWHPQLHFLCCLIIIQAINVGSHLSFCSSKRLTVLPYELVCAAEADVLCQFALYSCLTIDSGDIEDGFAWCLGVITLYIEVARALKFMTH